MEKNVAGFWIRLAALLIDEIILSIITSILMVIIFVPASFMGDEFLIIALIIFYGLSFVIMALYMTILPCTKLQGTIGKKVLGIKIVDENNQRISFGRSLGRYLSFAFISSIFYIGYIMVAVHEEKRGLHDLIAKTYVVYDKK